ncbi:MAG: hypothetical protein ACXAD7_02005 [Candidatus Kariarchaeaceae archaeon]
MTDDSLQFERKTVIETYDRFLYNEFAKWEKQSSNNTTLNEKKSVSLRKLTRILKTLDD